MNTKLTIGFITALIATAAAGCSDKSCRASQEQKSPEGITDFEVVQTVKSLQFDYLCENSADYYGDSTAVYSTVRMAIEWPVRMGGHDIKVLQDSLLTSIFGTDAKGEINESMLAAAAAPEGHDMFKMKRVDSIPSAIPAMVYSRDVIASAITFSPMFMVYQILTATYDGGAHGMTESRYVNYDFTTNSVITYGQTFKEGSEEALLQAIKDNLLTQYNASSLKELSDKGIFVDQLYVSRNFYLQGYDVVFHYNPYDIAPYSEGSIDVRVPCFQISEWLKPEVSRLLTENNF